LVTRFRRLLGSLTAAVVALLLACPVSASARERDVPHAGPLPPSAQLQNFDSTVLRSAAGALRPARAAGSASRRYATPDGYSVAVEASSDYPVDPVADQQLVDFLASRVHGAELGDLSVYVGKPAQISQLCGGDPGVVACYAINEGRMYVPGESVRGIPIEYPLTHEYGHHVASRRVNTPWDALDWGAKYWSSAMRICAGVRNRQLFPGNQGAHYWDDPGEGFADGYAHMHYPNQPWFYNELMRPNAKAFTAIRRDVLHPWTGPRSRTFHGRLGRKHRSRTFHIRVALDGDVGLRLRAPRGTVYEVQAEIPGFAAGQRLRNGGDFGVEWCRHRPVDRVELTVRRRAGSGPFALRVSWPG
jgi:hypothetical protein